MTNDLGTVGSRPVPDPTLLTTEQLLREIANLKAQISTRLDGYDKAISLLQSRADQSPGIPEIVAEFREKFNSVAVQFQSAKEAVSEQQYANVQAISKSEASVEKQLDQIEQQIAIMSKIFDSKIEDIKARLNTIESLRLASRDAYSDPVTRRLAEIELRMATGSGRKEGGAAVWAFIGAGVLALLSLVGVVVSLM